MDGARLLSHARARPADRRRDRHRLGKLEERQCQSFGATAVLTKPFNIAEVLQIVGEISRRDAV